ncbi:efflux RND transporter periplasmic adaptor subunit [Pseudomonadota bacterium]
MSLQRKLPQRTSQVVPLYRNVRQWRWPSLLWFGIAALGFAAAYVAWSMWDIGKYAAAERTIAVQRKSFALEVKERGVVRPARVVPVKSVIMSNQAKLVWLHKEGEAVKKGQIVARFDTKPFIDAMEKAEQNLADTEAQLVSAEKALLLQKEENEGKIEAANRELEIASIKADDLRHGTGQLNREELSKELNQAKRVYRLAESELNDFEIMLVKGHVSQRERDTAANKLASAEEALELAQHRADNFDRFEMPRLLREADLMIDAATKEQERVQRTSELELKRRQSAVVKKQRDIKAAQKQYDKAKEDLKNSDVRAPIDGTLLYVKLPNTESRRKAQVGDAIWLGQKFMEIPDTSELVVEINIREVDVTKLQPGMAALVELDAFSGEEFTGKVESIESLASADRDNEHLRYFRTRIRLQESAPTSLVGMSANVTITYRYLRDVLAIPTAGIHYRAGSAAARVRNGEEVVFVPVKLGAIGSDWAEVASGLKEGDQVIVN